ncbi:hypothetical protein L211DRAFT_246218 [Terfezia boudieri ATCC MYA-4762]|uniref:Uncharacterized protein n=1 Tax=Terfezia boudieri ATCC MYA-4762 TaxID=1051890 RepID=A0A3N4M4W5_9PEZI|nr:hypothetical protein L211DRAFT_246218 [Terfezia boudieri ATCC MYA-4762]
MGAGVRGALEAAIEEEEVLVMTDSQAAMMAMVAAGEDEMARTEDLKWVVEEIGRRQERVGGRAVRLGWVKAHVWRHVLEDVALSCPAGEWLGRRWSTWEQADERERWLRKIKDRDKEEEVVVDLVETFFMNLESGGADRGGDVSGYFCTPFLCSFSGSGGWTHFLYRKHRSNLRRGDFGTSS